MKYLVGAFCALALCVLVGAVQDGQTILDLTELESVPKFGGTIYYVDGVGGLDTNSGKTPGKAYATIGKAIGELSEGDAVAVAAATYTEIGLDLNVSKTELWMESGVVIDPASGTALTISGSDCSVSSRNGGFWRMTPAQDTTGILMSGAFAAVSNVRMNCNGGTVGTSADIGFDITGNGCDLHNCRVAGPDVVAYKIQGNRVHMHECQTGGLSGYTSIGYQMTNSNIKARLFQCSSEGHETAGFQIDTLCTDGLLVRCVSGAGDGKWSDADDSAAWVDFEYDRIKHKTITFNGSTTYNIFKVTGGVKVHSLYGHFTTATPATGSVINLELYSTNASVDITDAAGAPDVVSRVVGTVVSRHSLSSDPLLIVEPNSTPGVIEDSSFRDPQTPIIVVKDDAALTYIQAVLSVAVASGAIRWHVEWEPVTDDGFLEVAP